MAAWLEALPLLRFCKSIRAEYFLVIFLSIHCCQHVENEALTMPLFQQLLSLAGTSQRGDDARLLQKDFLDRQYKI